MELNCKYNHNPSITKLIDHAQLHVKIAQESALDVIEFVQITGF